MNETNTDRLLTRVSEESNSPSEKSMNLNNEIWDARGRNKLSELTVHVDLMKKTSPMAKLTPKEQSFGQKIATLLKLGADSR